MSDVITGVTEINAASLANINNVAQLYLQQKSILLNTCTNYSSLAVKGSKSIALPKMGGFTIETKVENTALSAQSLTATADTISFNKSRAIQWLNEEIAENQAMIDLKAEQIMRAIADLAVDADLYVIEQLKLASTSNPDHNLVFTDTATDVIAAADILAAKSLLEAQYINWMDCFIGIGPEKMNELLAISGFVDAEKWGDSMPKQRGVIGTLYGARVVMHTGFADFFCAWHPTAVGYAYQRPVTYQELPALEHLGVRSSLDYRAGFSVLDSGKRNVFIDSTN